MECPCTPRITLEAWNDPHDPLYGPHSTELAPVWVKFSGGVTGRRFRVCTNHIQFYSGSTWELTPVEHEEPLK